MCAFVGSRGLGLGLSASLLGAMFWVFLVPKTLGSSRCRTRSQIPTSCHHRSIGDAESLGSWLSGQILLTAGRKAFQLSAGGRDFNSTRMLGREMQGARKPQRLSPGSSFLAAVCSFVELARGCASPNQELHVAKY